MIKYRSLLLVLFAVLFGIRPGLASAEPRKLVIELRGRPEHLPSAVCVVGFSTSDFAQQDANGLIPLSDIESLFEKRDTAGAEPTFVIGNLSATGEAGRSAREKAPALAAAKRSEKPKVDPAEQKMAHRDHVRSLLGSEPANPPATCNSVSGDSKAPANACERSFRARLGDFVVCQHNPGISAEVLALRRVLFVSLRSLYTLSPELVRMDARGNALVITLNDDLKLPKGQVAPLRAAIAGGDYAEDTNPSVGMGEQLSLELIPRCAKHALTVTGGLLSPVEVTGEAGGPPRLRLQLSTNGKSSDISQCIAEPHESPLSVVLPYQLASSTTLALTVEQDGAEAQAAKLAFEASWDGAVPPATVLLKAKQVRFEWEQHCAYPWPKCPTDVTLPDAGVQCKLENKDEVPLQRRCSYSCPGSAEASSSAPFTLPQAVQFTIHDSSALDERAVSETWTDTLYHSRQVLSSYVAPPQRHIAVDFAAWRRADLQVPAQEVQYVEVRSPGGQLYRVKPKEGAMVALGMPGITCTDHVSYRPIGDRQWDEDVVPVKQGGIRPMRPGDKVKDALSVGLSLGAGIKPAAFEVVHGKDDMAAFGWGDFVALYRRPRIFKPKMGVPNLELRAGLLYTVASYVTRGSADSTDVVAGTTPYLFVPSTLDGVWDFEKGVSFSFGLGGAFALPTRSSTKDLAPKQWSPLALVALGVRLPGSPVTIELMSKLFLADFYEVQLQPDGRQPRTEARLAPPIFVGVGARVGN